ncbi:Ulp1 family isopeptidase [Rhizobium gallicum]|uniref:Ulp1 family isopeptidase n=1 Tax=Rhizobium gallicum TaxID=56730 RepID=UPI001EF8DFA6|nr:Ulp1 family isopeptidase [Rhizobium gallicum]ULJ74465.1 Ulp1 family isopeptidase [Rhizobium gallicum]
MRYTALSEVPPAARAKDGKSRGLFSRVKSGLAKALGTNRRDKKWSEGSNVAYSEDVVHTEFRMDFAKREGMHSDDERCIDQFVEAVRNYEILPDGSIGRGDGRVPEGTITNNAGYLMKFARWLRVEGRDSMASRVLIDSESFAADIEDYKASSRDVHNRLTTALSHLRRFVPGERELRAVGPGPRLMGRQTTCPHPDDARIIDAIARKDLSNDPQERNKALEVARRQRRFSDWLRKEGRKSIVSRITGSDEQRQSLDNDHREFTKAFANPAVNINRLRLYLGAEPIRKPNRTPYHPYPDDARIIDRIVNERMSKLGKSETSKRKSASAQANRQRKFSDWLQQKNKGSIASRVNSDDKQKWSLKMDFWQFIEAEGKIDVGFRWFREAAVRADAALDLSSDEGGEQEKAGPGGRSQSDQPVGMGSTWPLEQVDASIQGRSGLSLGPREWLEDRHIQRDYELLMEELRGSNPDLASRTRFVDPLIAFQVGNAVDRDALTALHRLFHDRNGNDSADFLFLPVNDASVTDPNRRGTHWSLLLVDRRDRERPAAAYHYDSSWGRNDEPAERLARRVGANLRGARMRQQENGFDCGVFVVDGTRALVQGLARRQSPAALPLENLVANREQLQIRLSSGQVAVAADRPGPSTQFVDSASSDSTWVRDLPTPFWEEEAGLPPADSWNTANFSPRPAYPPVESTPQSFEQSLGASIFGPTQYMPYPQDLGAFVPPSWQHGNQRAPEDLMRGMHWNNVLPSAARPQINISIHGVPYTAALGPSGKQNDINVFQQGGKDQASMPYM